MARKHAVLSASSAARWIACPPSARLNADKSDMPSEYAAQGTDAHALCEYKLRKALGEKARDPTKHLASYDTEMEECAEAYCQFVMELVGQFRAESKDTMVSVEQRVDFSAFVPDGFGTADTLIVSGKTVCIVDYKHGKGIEVSADHNPQMMCYALGCVQLFDGLYDIGDVRMVIFQPRLANISEFSISKANLLAWAADTLVPAAKLTHAGEGEFSAGAHCQFCKIKATCRKRAEYNLELARYDFEMPPTLEDAEVEAVLAKADTLAAWVSDIKEYALQRAIQGKQWADWKLVEGRSNRKYTDETAVAKTVKEAGFEPYEQKLLGITAMTALLGKSKFEELLGGFIVKPQGKPTLAPMSDKRPVMNTAAEDFKES
ncbi:hypothetical protein HMPREF9162_0074 [Selenomonas sp. oral taxon 137 str. F0430]|uniref:DUF2800 domain-containing protein n=1 Tax=Selenomonas sp. oral taxon 137 TaxID=712531 RepID=UPI0001EB1F0E|nr:DUF2800 domain-containing protein [Selenomonas sp. oral taxon 137]EFR40373.1 hypothetical protein HMPREF9162_0074 [Selenomonas sp. oral taxon 137 str. F0430]